jgi:hypothetical protein
VVVASDALADVLDVALRVAAAIEANGGEYFVGGSLASSLQGDPRATNDIDFVVSLPLGRLEAFRESLGEDFELDVEMLRDALLHARTANAFYIPLVTKIDFFGHSYEGFDEVEFSRRRKVVVSVSGDGLYLKSPEDTVLRKLLWYRDGGCVSEKQWRDVVAVLRVNSGKLDEGYLTSWATSLGIAELLGGARDTAYRQ